jgi:hypothetical protein
VDRRTKSTLNTYNTEVVHSRFEWHFGSINTFTFSDIDLTISGTKVLFNHILTQFMLVS